MAADWLDDPALRLSNQEARAVAHALTDLSSTTGWVPTGPIWTMIGSATILAGVYGSRVTAVRADLARKRDRSKAPPASTIVRVPPAGDSSASASMPPPIPGQPASPFAGATPAEAAELARDTYEGVYFPPGVPWTSQADRDAPA